MTLPLLSLSSRTFGADYTESFHRIGFGAVTDHGVPYDLIHATEEEVRKFFEMAQSFKAQFPSDPVTEVGWVGKSGSTLGKKVDLKEFMVNRPFMSGVTLPTAPHFDLSILNQYAAEQQRVGLEIVSRIEPVVSQHAPQFKNIAASLRDSTPTTQRVNYFPAYRQEDDDGSVPAAGHRDLGFLTILSPAREQGLWACDRTHDRTSALKEENHNYIPAFNPAEDQHFFVTNIGEVCSLFTGGSYDFVTGQVNPDGYLPATWHGVDKLKRSNASAARISSPMFMHLKPETPLVRISEEQLNAVASDPRLKEEMFAKHRATILKTVEVCREHDRFLLAGMLVWNRLVRHGTGKALELS